MLSISRKNKHLIIYYIFVAGLRVLFLLDSGIEEKEIRVRVQICISNLYPIQNWLENVKNGYEKPTRKKINSEQLNKHKNKLQKLQGKNFDFTKKLK